MSAIAIREAYGRTLVKLGEENPRIVALEADVGGSSRSVLFGQKFPERYFNVGIAEINMASMAAGLATQGFIPFINTFASFMVTRAGDPMQSLAAYDKLNVKFAGTYAGMSDAFDGASHHSLSDIAFVRALPNMTIIAPCDEIETAKAVKAAVEIDGPVYLRLSRDAAPVIFGDDYDFRVGKGVVVREGGDITIVATGTMVQTALDAAKLLEAQGVSARVVDMHTILPLDTELLVESAQKTGCVVTVEEHSVRGGLGGAVAEALGANCPVKMGIVGIEDFAESGPYAALLKKYGLDGAHVAEKCMEVLKRK